VALTAAHRQARPPVIEGFTTDPARRLQNGTHAQSAAFFSSLPAGACATGAHGKVCAVSNRLPSPMIDSFVTRCPHCSTRLRVTHGQISAAAGMVRCGICLQTFNAHEHLLENTTGAVASGMDELLIHDDLDLHDLGLDDLDLEEELAQIEAQEQAFSKELLDLSQQIQGNDRHPPAQDDESWAEALLREEEGEGEETPPASTEQEESQRTEKTSADVSPDSAFWLPSKESLDAPVELAALAGDRLQITTEEPPAPLAMDLSADTRAETAFLSTQEEFVDFVEPIAVDEPLAEVEAPRQTFLPASAPPVRGRVLWGLAIAATLLLLAGQYVFFHFDSLMRQERYRPLFASLCPLIGCTLPERIDISQIRSSNLVVHSHPRFADALKVDVILYNQAVFAQPFPLLELEFSSLAGNPVARRRFTPVQYLADAMQQQTQMPSQIPVHIALEIQDPGKDAVNYSLKVLPPDSL